MAERLAIGMTARDIIESESAKEFIKRRAQNSYYILGYVNDRGEKLYLHPTGGWKPDPSKALRFDSKQGAEFALAMQAEDVRYPERLAVIRQFDKEGRREIPVIESDESAKEFIRRRKTFSKFRNTLRPENFDFETDFNPDGMTFPEMSAWINVIGPGRRPRAADVWFPGRLDRFTVVVALRKYLLKAQVARKLRAGGHIDRAREIEDECDYIYGQLPGYARW